MAKITKSKFKKAMKGSRGILSRIAERLDVSRNAVSKFVQKNPDVQEWVDDEKEMIFDLAEDNVLNALKSDNPKMVKWATDLLLLKHKKGKEREFGERQEVEQIGDNSVRVEFVEPDNKKDDEEGV